MGPITEAAKLVRLGQARARPGQPRPGKGQCRAEPGQGRVWEGPGQRRTRPGQGQAKVEPGQSRARIGKASGDILEVSKLDLKLPAASSGFQD